MEIGAPDILIAQLRKVLQTFPDYRTGANTRYSIEDAALGAFGGFFCQSPSFLAYQRQMQTAVGRNNAQSLLGVHAIPDDIQIRRLLDGVSPKYIFPVFIWCFEQMVQSGGIQQFKSELGYLLALDGTGFFGSSTLHCKNCTTKTEKKTGKTTYLHSALTPVLVKPGGEHVFSLVPEYIVPQDGDIKQDCENKACKRWLTVYGKTLASIEEDTQTTLLGDDLYSKQPVIETILDKGLQFILVCKRESHKWLYDWVDNLEEQTVPETTAESTTVQMQGIRTVTIRSWNGKSSMISTYRYANHVPLRDTADSLFINWCEVTITNEKTGIISYHNAFITSHVVTGVNIETIIVAGRTRWKVENENNNTLKTKGYHFEHNYGHGESYLSSLLLSLILLAFLFHTLLDLFWEPYRMLKARLTRQVVFESIRALTRFFFCPGWKQLFYFMHKQLDNIVPLPPTPFGSLPSG